MKCYFKGDWKAAKQIFIKTEEMIEGHKDGPSRVLINNMEDLSHGSEKAPADWKGFRFFKD